MIAEFFKGLLIGIGTIAPGVSGGTIAVILGVYERITGAIANIFTGLFKKIKDLLPLGIGGIVGILAFSRITNYLFQNFEVEVKYLFIGLMLGTFPALRRQADKQGFDIKYLIPFVSALIVTIVFGFMEGVKPDIIIDSKPGLLLLVVYGIIIGFGTIIPGISSSFILMYLGAYHIILEGISNLDLAILIPAGAGLALSIFGFAKLIDVLFKKAYGYTYYAIIGFTLGSMTAIFPGFGFNWHHLFGVILFGLGCALTYQLSKYEKTGQ